MTTTTIKRMAREIGTEYDRISTWPAKRYDSDVDTFDTLLGLFPDVIRALVTVRGDAFTSDRECAAAARVIIRTIRAEHAAQLKELL